MLRVTSSGRRGVPSSIPVGTLPVPEIFPRAYKYRNYSYAALENRISLTHSFRALVKHGACIQFYPDEHSG